MNILSPEAVNLVYAIMWYALGFLALLLALSWVWFPFMVKGRLDTIIRKLDMIEHIQTKQYEGAQYSNQRPPK